MASANTPVPEPPASSSRLSAPSPEQTPARRSAIVLAAVGLALVVVAALAWHLVARSSFDRAGSPAISLEQRAAAAQRARAMEPWNAGYDRRARLLSAWLLGSEQLARGEYNAAVVTLDAAYRLDIGNQALLALDHKAQEAQALATNRKAHLQHGHEGPGGTLRPQDVER
jgi:hypothetical protein